MTMGVDQALRIVEPSGVTQPIVLSSPHSGETYPSWFLNSVNCSAERLRILQDGPIDRLAAPATVHGAKLIAAVFPRAIIDVNRAPGDMTSEMARMFGRANTSVSAKAKAGLGVVPTQVGDKPIYRDALTASAIKRRFALAYEPFHRELQETMERRRARHGFALLLDCHSMPSVAAWHGRRRVDVALGDRFGTCCSHEIVRAVRARLEQAGLRCALNHPYAGGHVSERHGRPEAGMNALQLEFRRDLFMNEETYRPHQGFRKLQATLAQMIEDLLGDLGQFNLSLAA